MNTIKARCFTNLDEYDRETWPTVFVTVPRIGERVEAESGRSLKVVCVTHCLPQPDQPRLKIELHR